MFKRTIMLPTLIMLGMICFTSAHAALVVTARYSPAVAFRAPIQGQEGSNSPVSVYVTAWCEPGEKVTGGGHQGAPEVKGFSVAYSGPKYDMIVEGWTVGFQIDEAYPSGKSLGNGFAYAMCTKQM